MVLQAGDKLQKGKYTIEKELGRGRFAITYLAQRPDGFRRVLKVLNPQVLAELEAIAPSEKSRLENQFLQEAMILAKCKGSPHIAQVDMPFQEDGRTYLPIEYMDGNSLADRAERILPEEQALKYIRQVGEALAAVHQNQLVHCDIRPANIFLRSRAGVQEAVLADFGLALEFESQLTRTRERERIDGFSAPELYTCDRPIGAHTDIYSLAATLYDLVTGEAPIGYQERLGNKKLVSPKVKNPLISNQTANALLQGLEMDPERRSDSVQDWLATLPALKPPITPTTPKKMNWQTFWMAAAAIVAVLAGVPAWLTWMDSKSSPSAAPKPTGVQKPVTAPQ